MILKLFWKLIYGSRKVDLKVYRVIEKREGLVLYSLVYENIEQGRFVQKTSFGVHHAFEVPDVNDLSDTWNALNGLKDVSFLIDSNTWNRLAAESIDEAVDKANTQMEELRHMRRRLSTVSNKPRGKRRARLSIKESLRPEAEDPSRIVGRPARQGTPTWKPIESTPSGRKCQILMIDGKGQHRVP